MASMPAMKLAVENLEKQGKVKFLLVNTQDSDGDKKGNLEKLLKDNKYPFSVLLDTDSKVRYQYKIMAIPTKLIIDENGIIKFRSIGFGGTKEDFVKELQLMLKLTGEKSN
jgi:hypothetical protein